MSAPSDLSPPFAEFADFVPGEYLSCAGNQDEFLDASGAVRPHFAPLFARLRAIGKEALQGRWEQARRQIHENGVSFNVHGDADGMQRPWTLSLLPVVVPNAEWAALERGLAQRALLLDILLDDLYGAGESMAQGLLPPELVYGRPSFLRACHGFSPALGRRLIFYAADLLRDPSGTMRVFADRTQAPSGAGYALENRIVISQALPEAFKDSNVRRLAVFFRRVQETLSAIAPRNRDNPRVVLLTPGPFNSTYFEQAYLAQYLGLTLVAGADLTVREGRVFLKTLGGLQPIDVILRRVNDDYCDPLECRPESLLGVPGLVEACRGGHVTVANALGSGLVRTPAFLPYLPALCRHFLGEDLLLPSVNTWWCGDPQSLTEVQSRFEDLVIKPTYANKYVHPTFVRELSSLDRAELWERIVQRPRDFVAQERVSPSTTPALVDGRLVPRSLVMRAFAVSANNGYEVMPGALSRVADTSSGFEVAMQLGADSKDTWILSDDPVETFSLLPPPSQPIPLSRGGGDLPSRLADNLFWLGRYTERAENTARAARTLLSHLSQADAGGAAPVEIAILAAAFAAQTEIPMPGLPEQPAGCDELAAALVTAVTDARHPNSVAACMRSILQVAHAVRHRLSLDTWKVLAALEDDLEPTQGGSASTAAVSEVAFRLSRAILRLAAFAGLASESMTRGQAWRFADIGRRLERASNQTQILRHALAHDGERMGPLLEGVLEIADSAMTYRRRYLAALQVAPVVDLLLTDETNPRAVVFQIVALEEHIRALPRIEAEVRSPQERKALAILAALRLAPVEELCRRAYDRSRPALVAFLDQVLLDLAQLSDSLTERYLSHATLSRNLATFMPRDSEEPPP